MQPVIEHYNETSKTYDAQFNTLYFKVFDAITWKYLELYVPTDLRTLVLDAGGGTGRWSVPMAKKGCTVVLLDASAGMLRKAQERATKEGLQHRIRLEKGDIRKLKYRDETFDMILCEHALFLLDDLNIAIKEFARVLKKGKTLIVSVQNRYIYSLAHIAIKEIPQLQQFEEAHDILLHQGFDAMTKDGKVKIYTWTPDEFRGALERNGFDVQKIVGKGMTMPIRVREELYLKKDYPEDLFNRILQLELALCEKPDALALAGHLQAIARKQ